LRLSRDKSKYSHDIESSFLPGRPRVHEVGELLHKVEEHAAEGGLKKFKLKLNLSSTHVLLLCLLSKGPDELDLEKKVFA
jgi:hypothetical protein